MNVSNTSVARFPCPACGKSEIARCADCRANAAVYECKDCGFRGPN
ncbi:RNA-binding protein [Candidatus Woesearchaeota archaeon]|nr:RNA-binding protein [Candidatus Woesearchaeota archaeon]